MVKGTTDRITNANIQLHVNAMISAANAAEILCTRKVKVSPTRHLIVEASVANLAPTAPLNFGEIF